MSGDSETPVALIMTLVAESEVLANSVRRMERIVFDLGAAGADLMAGLQELERKEPELRVSESLALAILQANSATTELAPALTSVASSVNSFLMAAEKLVAVIENRNSPRKERQ